MTLQFPNYSKKTQRIFINGKEQRLSFLNEIKISGKNRIVLRVQTRGREHFIQTVDFQKDIEKVIEIPETPEALFGYLKNSSACLNGTLYFKLYGESRIEKLPLKSALFFPLINAQKTTYTIINVRKNGVRKKIQFSIEREEETIDLCNL